MNYRLLSRLALVLLACLLLTGCKKSRKGLTQIPDGQSALLDGGEEEFLGGMGGGDSSLGGGLAMDESGMGGGLFGSEEMGSFDSEEWVLPDETMFGSNEDRQTLATYTVYFGYDRSAILPQEMAKVESVADYLDNNPSAQVKIEGHCDERGTDEYNRALGERRALSLREMLVNLGVSPDRVITESWGEDRLADFGTDASAHSKNRRGEFVLLLP